MKVREWIALLSEIDPEQEVKAMNLLGEWIKVAPIAGRAVTRKAMLGMALGEPRAAFVKIVREDDRDPPPQSGVRW